MSYNSMANNITVLQLRPDLYSQIEECVILRLGQQVGGIFKQKNERCEWLFIWPYCRFPDPDSHPNLQKHTMIVLVSGWPPWTQIMITHIYMKKNEIPWWYMMYMHTKEVRRNDAWS